MSFADWSNEKKKREREAIQAKNTQAVLGDKTSFSDWSNSKKVSGIDQDYINAFITDVNKFFSTADDDFKSLEWGTASSLYTAKRSTWNDLDVRATHIGEWLNRNKGKLDEDTYNNVSEALKSYRSEATSVIDSFKKAKDYYSQWNSEDSYNDWYSKNKRIFDLQDSAKSASDFDEYSKKGASIENPTMKEAEGWMSIGDWRLGGEDIGNIVTYSRDNETGLRMGAVNGSRLLGDVRYSHMTDEEVGVYNYYLAKYGEGKANEYLESIDDLLDKREAGQMAEAFDDNAFLESIMGFSAGVESAVQGLKGLADFVTGNESGRDFSANQYADQIVSSNNEGVIKGFHDVSSAIGGMLPSILVSTVTGNPVLGAATMGASAMGNAYNEMVELGYNEWQARGYGVLVGASEAVLQYFIGGISKLGGKVTGNALGNLVAKLDNAIARTAIQVGGNMISEGVEEALQTVLEPAFKALMTGEEFESPEWEDVWYSALLGALTAGVMEGAPTIANTAIQSYQAKSVYGANPQALVSESLEIDPENAHAQRMQARLDGGKNVSGYQLNRLVEANEQTLVKQDIAKMTSAVEARLAELGETGDVSKLAKVIVKNASGESLSLTDKALMKNSKFGLRVATEMTPDNIESEKFAGEWATKIGTNRINTEAYNKGLYDLAMEQAGADGGLEVPTATDAHTEQAGFALDEKNVSVTKNPTAKENATEVKFEASTDGKTRIGDMEVSIKEIASVKDGEVILRLEDGSTVNARDVDLASADEVILYESVADMNLNAATANAFIRGYEPSMSAEEYALGFKEAYRYGEYGYPAQKMSADGFSARLSESQKSLAYNLGKTDAKYKVEKNQSEKAKIASIGAIKAGKDSQKTSKKGKLHNTLNPTNETQRASLKALGVLAEALNIDIYTFESPTDAKGRRVGENGSYDPVTRTLRIDLFAGARGDGTMLFTAAHELTHHIRATLPAKFKVFANFLFEQYGEKGVSVSDLIAEKIKHLEANGRTKGKTEAEIYDLAYEEVVADSCESFLADGEAVAKIAELKAKDKTLWETIKDFITKLVARIKAAYEGLRPDSVEGSLVAEMLDTAEQLKAMWTEMLVEASAVNSDVEHLAEAGIGFDSETRSVYSLRYSPARKDADGNVVDLVSRLAKVGKARTVILTRYDMPVRVLADSEVAKAVADYIGDTENLAIKESTVTPSLSMELKNLGISVLNEEQWSQYDKDFPTDTFGETKYSDREIQPITESETKDLEKHFGTTGNFKVAGYLLTDGKLLDYSGKHWGDTTSRSRQVDHRDVQEVLGRGNNGIDDMVDMIGSGNIRLMPEIGGINLAVYPNEKQRKVLSVYINYMLNTEGQVIIDYDAVGGDTVYSKEYGKTATSRQILNDIRNYFNGARQSDLMRFHTMYSDRSTDSFSNRSLLANALESVAQNDIERKKLEEYKGKIALIESEQAKLAEVRKKAYDIRFTKGRTADETKKMKDLEFEANQIANRINTYDKQLLNLESTKALKDVLQREKQMAYKRAEQKGKEALAAYRERSIKTTRELMTRYQESRKKNVEGRKQTAMRHKIKDVVNELNQYLLKGTKDKHVPIELQKAVAEALDAVNMDTVGADERIAKLEAELMKAKTPEAIQDISRKIDHIREMGERMDGKLQALKNAYDDIVNSKDPLIAKSHDEVISNSIARVIKEVGDTPLRDMTLTQLEAVYDMYKMVLTTIRNTNKAFKAEKGKEISVLANTVLSDLDGKKRNPLNPLDTTFAWNNLKPVYAFERIGSRTFTNLFNAVREGEDVWARDMSEAQAFREEQAKKYKFDSWDFDKKYSFTTHRGTPFELTLGEMMSIYAFAKDEHSKGHLIGEGFVFDPKKEVVKKVKGKIEVKVNLEDATAYNLSEEIVSDIVSKIPQEAKDFADAMQDYLSTTMGAKGNEVSLELYDIKLFKNKVYFPLKSAPQYMAVAKEQAQGEVKIKNKGFTKDRKEGAQNPIVLSSFMDVWANHVNEMAMYHAFTLPLEDFYRVFNYKTPKMEGYAPMAVNASLENAYGKGAVAYVDQLLKDLNGGARVDSTAGIINKLTGLFKKSAVFASLSVVVQQPSAIARATALVDSKYFVGKPSGKHKEVWAEVKKYAPVAIIKEMGYFDTGMGQSSVEWLKGDKTWKDKLDDIVSKAPSLADEYAWCAIWNAVKRETLHTHKDLKPNSDEFLKAVGERFTEVITKTQVYDSVLSRSANMRSKDTGMKMATAFLGEPTTSINMIQDALTQGKRGNKRYARKAIGGVVASMILNSILVSIVYAGRDDDEEKTYAEKYIGTLTEELLDSINPLTLIPFVKDIVSIAQGYDVERSDMAVITDLINAWNNLESDNRSVYRKVEDFAGAIASIFGLPVKNVMRDVRGIYNTVNSFINGEKTTGAGIKNAIVEAVTGDEKSNGQQLYEAIIAGDSAQIERVEGRFEDQKEINTAIRKALRNNDPRIKEAAEARYNGDIAGYMRIAKEIIAEGNFSQDNIVAAINSEINALKKGEGTSESTTSNKVESIYKMDDYYMALKGRDQATAYAVKEDLIKTDVANGKDREEAEADFNSRFTSHLRDMYEDGEISDYEAENMLVNYGGKSYEDASSKVQYWEFKKRYPDYDLSEEAVKKYYSDVEPSGIGVGVYYDYSKQRAKCKGTDSNGDGKTDSGSVKAEVMEVINSLPITSYQKDVLYYLNGWSANTIWEAPWH